MNTLKVLPHYQATLTHLWRIEKPGIRLDLAPMRALMKKMGEPWRSFPSILVAGTNGKGSTASILSEILACSGYKVGLYTSPHLSTYRERITIKTSTGTLPFNEASWCRSFARVEEAMQSSGAALTQFEILTALGFSIFEEERVDVAVLEVGLGGRLDATNVVDPILGLIAEIDFDHREYLGNTLASIAFEKAGIMRPDVPCLALGPSDEVLRVFSDRARAVGARLSIITPGKLESLSLDGQSFTYGNEKFALRLLGEHQVKNGSLAIEAARRLRDCGFAVNEEKIREGVARAAWPARFEVIARRPVIVLDGAHNPHGAAALARTLDALALPRPHVLVLGILEGKDTDGILGALAPWGDAWVLCRSASPRAIPPDALLAASHAIVDGKNLSARGRVGEACRDALSRLRGEGTLCVAGSLTVAGEARRILTRRGCA